MRAYLKSLALSSAHTIVSPPIFLKKEIFFTENFYSQRGTNPDIGP